MVESTTEKKEPLISSPWLVLWSATARSTQAPDRQATYMPPAELLQQLGLWRRTFWERTSIPFPPLDAATQLSINVSPSTSPVLTRMPHTSLLDPSHDSMLQLLPFVIENPSVPLFEEVQDFR